MAKDAPDERAQKLASKLLGQSPDRTVADLIAGSATVGKRDAEGKPFGERSNVEDFTKRGKPNRGSSDDDDDEQEFDFGDEDEEDDTDDEGVEDDDYEEDDSDAEDDEGEDDEGEDDEDDGDDYETSDYDDEDTLEVKVDGEVKEVSLRELKRIYSLNEATEKRLKEATEARTAANAERESVQTEIQTHRANMLHTIQQLDGVLFAPLVEKPNPKLRTTNMQEYLLQQDAWEEDQRRIAASREELTEFIKNEQTTMTQARASYRQQQMQLLSEKMPELADPEKTRGVQQSILDAASYYGFTPEMVAQVDHHGLFLMARDAARWLNMQKIKKSGKVPPTDGENRIKRRKAHLKAGNGGTKTKLSLVRSQKERAVATNKARQTGRVDDVANMLISNAKTRGSRNGRGSKDV